MKKRILYFGMLVCIFNAMYLSVVSGNTVSENEVISEIITAEEENLTPKEVSILDSGSYGKLQWSIDSDGLLTISGTGGYSADIDALPFWYYSSSKKYITSAKVNVTGIWSTYGMFCGCYNLKTVDLSGLDTSQVVSMARMFAGCESLETVDLSGFDTSKVTDMSGMFSTCGFKQLPDMSNFDISNVTDMSEMFASCHNLESANLSGFKTSKVTNMLRMFYYCDNLKQLDLSNFDTSNVTDMSEVFSWCQGLESVNLSGFKTSKVTDMHDMFYNCEKLKAIDLSSFDTSSVTDMSCMFSNCRTVQELDLSNFDTSKVTDMYSMFSSCESLKELDVSSFDVADCKTGYIFSGVDNLEVAVLPNGLIGQKERFLPYLPTAYEGSSATVFGDAKKLVPLPKGTILKAEQLTEIDGKVPPTSTFIITNNDSKNPEVAFCGVSNVNSPEVTIPKVICYKAVVYRVTSIAITDFVSAGDNAVYKVTSNQIGQCMVEYLAPKSKKSKVTIPSETLYKGVRFRVMSIAAKAFKNNKKVKEIVVSDSIITIGNDAFYGCKKLKKVTLGKGVTRIGNNAFRNCKKLTRITLKSQNLTSVGKKALKGINKKCKIKVPKKKLKKYKKLFKKKGQATTVKVVK